MSTAHGPGTATAPGPSRGDPSDDTAEEVHPVPIYAFVCESCGPFELSRGFGEASAPGPCPACRRAGRRVYTAPGLVRTPGPLRPVRDAEERSAHEPDVVSGPRGDPLPWRRHHDHRTPPWVVSGC